MRSTRAPLKLQDLDALPTSVSTNGSSQVTLKEEEHDINFTRLSRLLQVMDIVAQEHVMGDTIEEKKQKTIQFQNEMEKTRMYLYEAHQKEIESTQERRKIEETQRIKETAKIQQRTMMQRIQHATKVKKEIIGFSCGN